MTLRDRPVSIKKSDAKLVLNMAKCLNCKHVLISSHVHDFRTCTCGGMSVDGGNEYVRRLAQDFNDVLELSLYIVDDRFYHDEDLTDG